LQASDLLVNGAPADNVTRNAADTSATFPFSVDPVVTRGEGLQTMTSTAGSIIRNGDPRAKAAAQLQEVRFCAAVRSPIMHNPYLIGPTVYLRPLEPEDAPTVVVWFNDPEVNRFLLSYRPMTRAAEEDFLRRLSESSSDIALGIVTRAADRLVGVAGLHHLDVRNRHAGLGINLGARDCWSKGLGTETTRLLLRHAFHTLNLNRVWLHVYEYNARGIHVYEKVGFRLEGRLRQDTFRDGRYWDTLVMGLLRDEWVDAEWPHPQHARGTRSP
jgi:RimJ/RimL family protein N-acetyltransferase